MSRMMEIYLRSPICLQSMVLNYLSTETALRGMHIGYWWEIQKERDHWEDQDVGWWTTLKWILER
jgi:hypothetical protein